MSHPKLTDVTWQPALAVPRPFGYFYAAFAQRESGQSRRIGPHTLRASKRLTYPKADSAIQAKRLPAANRPTSIRNSHLSQRVFHFRNSIAFAMLVAVVASVS